MRKVKADELIPAYRELVSRAADALRYSYSPYSGFAVGAALLSEDGQIITGVNVENASYSLTICAERSAVAAAVSQGVKIFRAIAVIAAVPGEIITPCGACRQVLLETSVISGSDIDVILSDSARGRMIMTTARELLPLEFHPGHLSGK